MKFRNLFRILSRIHSEFSIIEWKCFDTSCAYKPHIHLMAMAVESLLRVRIIKNAERVSVRFDLLTNQFHLIHFTTQFSVSSIIGMLTAETVKCCWVFTLHAYLISSICHLKASPPLQHGTSYYWILIILSRIDLRISRSSWKNWLRAFYWITDRQQFLCSNHFIQIIEWNQGNRVKIFFALKWNKKVTCK